jgi:hypothetical protein
LKFLGSEQNKHSELKNRFRIQPARASFKQKLLNISTSEEKENGKKYPYAQVFGNKHL